ncbi:arylesterase [Pontibacter silvestris]|uniref:Arylesterase n=1 Tax=Pontibacter silvestris TaxID=2305183 RepID=A0ABW4WXQ3_9BACT|nr:arylesterase [Pontibacter silvestris]MCC9135389.1 arylesterase [Pontibacter silvestris]
MKIKNNILTICLLWLLCLGGCDANVETKEQTATKQQTNEEGKADIVQTNEHTQTIVFFGNSLTAGYGLEPDQAFPALIQNRIDSLNLSYKVVNAGVSGETSAGGKSRIDWLLRQPIDIFVLELGANDGLRGIDPSSTYQNLQTIIQKVREKNPNVRIVLAGMQMPPSMGQNFTQEFREVYTRLAEDENVELIPFLLEGVAGISDLNQSDGVHPTVEGQKILAENVWEVLAPILKENAS